MKDRITLRPAGPEDREFLFRVYAAMREEELSVLPWDEAQKAAFLRMQFDARERSYHAHRPDASFDLILRDGREVGRFSVDRGSEAFHVVDIALLPEHRDGGIGGSLLSGLIDEARRAGRPVRLEVERHNRASGLYRRLGFEVVGDDGGVYLAMERRPDGGG